MTTCKYCSAEFEQPTKYRKEFCSRSCSASFNNKRKTPRSLESRLKTSHSIKSLIINGTFNPMPPIKNKISEYPYTRLYGTCICNSCGKVFWQISYRQHCCSTQCVDSIRSQNKCRKTQIIYFNINENKNVILQSTWEVKIAEWLDANYICWTRPSTRIKWYDTTLNKYRTYLPDFYIVDHRVFLDVKNPIKMIEDRDKLSQLVAVMPLFIGNIQQVQDYMVGLTGLEPVS